MNRPRIRLPIPEGSAPKSRRPLPPLPSDDNETPPPVPRRRPLHPVPEPDEPDEQAVYGDGEASDIYEEDFESDSDGVYDEFETGQEVYNEVIGTIPLMPPTPRSNLPPPSPQTGTLPPPDQEHQDAVESEPYPFRSQPDELEVYDDGVGGAIFEKDVEVGLQDLYGDGEIEEELYNETNLPAPSPQTGRPPSPVQEPHEVESEPDPFFLQPDEKEVYDDGETDDIYEEDVDVALQDKYGDDEIGEKLHNEPDEQEEYDDGEADDIYEEDVDVGLQDEYGDDEIEEEMHNERTLPATSPQTERPPPSGQESHEDGLDPFRTQISLKTKIFPVTDSLGFCTQLRVRQCFQCHGDTEFYCNTCKQELCLQCKERHLSENNTKYHKVVFYITRHNERSFTTTCKVRQCSQCQGDTEFYCNTCKCDLCLQCKEKHTVDLHIKHHELAIYREKFNYVPLRETCARHPNRRYIMFCDQCEYSVCDCCTEHRTHALVDLRTAYQTKRQKHRKIIDNIRSETLYNCRVLLAGIQTDIQICLPQICHRQSNMPAVAQRLKNMIDTVDHSSKIRYRLLQQKRNMEKYLLNMQNIVHKYEQLANRAVHFLLSIKTSRVNQVKHTPYLPQYMLLSLTEESNMEDASQFLRGRSEVQSATGKRQAELKECLRLMSKPVESMSITVKGVNNVYHISGVTSNLVWVSEYDNLVLTNTTGDTMHQVKGITTLYTVGLHTVNSSGELIYINNNYNIQKLSTNNKTVTTLLEGQSPWEPVCVYCSPSTGYLMVGVLNSDTNSGKIILYSSLQQHILTIQHNNTGETLYLDPRYITENNNGDIIVSDIGRHAVVVTERWGIHRFSYSGRPSGSSLSPRGICTDALSRILVCDRNTATVQMIDKDGRFLSLLLLYGIKRPHSLNYDHKTHLLWVGSRNSNTVSIYRYIQRRNFLLAQESQLRALCDYEAQEEDKLSFKTGDLLHLKDDSDPDWWFVRHYNPIYINGKTEGYVPSEYVDEECPLESYDWFMGTLSRKETERLLLSSGNEAGSFLVRESETKPGNYALSLRYYEDRKGDKVTHFLIHRKENNKGYYITERRILTSLPKLINHYAGHSDGLIQRLSKPCNKSV